LRFSDIHTYHAGKNSAIWKNRSETIHALKRLLKSRFVRQPSEMTWPQPRPWQRSWCTHGE